MFGERNYENIDHSLSNTAIPAVVSRGLRAQPVRCVWLRRKRHNSPTDHHHATLLGVGVFGGRQAYIACARGLNPSVTELESIRDGKATLETLAAQYTESDAFGETIKDMYAEILLIRAADLIFPREGPLGPISNSDVRNALSKSPST